jgi:hypothetical protein
LSGAPLRFQSHSFLLFLLQLLALHFFLCTTQLLFLPQPNVRQRRPLRLHPYLLLECRLLALQLFLLATLLLLLLA